MFVHADMQWVGRWRYAAGPSFQLRLLTKPTAGVGITEMLHKAWSRRA